MMKRIFGILAVISFFMLLGTVGSMECFFISLTQGAIQLTLSLISFGVFAKLAGAFEPYEDDYYSEDEE